MRLGLTVAVLLLLPITILGQTWSQNTAPFPFIINGDTLPAPLTGGLNRPDFRFLDWNGDGWDDIFLNDGDGRLQFWERFPDFESQSYSLNDRSFQGLQIGAWFVFFDFDADGDTDMLSQTPGTSNLSYLENIDGVFTLVSSILLDAAGDPVNGGLVVVPAITDINGDGLIDFFVGDIGGHLTYYKGIETEGNVPLFELVTTVFEGIEIIWTPRHGANSVEFFDLDADGDQDLLWGDFYQPGLFYLENFGTSSVPDFNQSLMITDFLQTAGALTAGYNAPRISDCDGDGDGDLTVGVLSGAYGQDLVNNLLYFENTGDAVNWSFSLVTRNYLPGMDFLSRTHPAFADIDWDGDNDLFVGNKYNPANPDWSGQIIYFQNTGSISEPVYTLIDSALFGGALGTSLAPAFADLDADGDLDALIGEFNGRLIELENIGSANAPLWQNTGFFMDMDLSGDAAPAFGDIDGDLDIDLLVGDKNGVISVYENIAGSGMPSVFTLTQEISLETQAVPAIAENGVVYIGTESGNIWRWAILAGGMPELLGIPYSGRFASPAVASTVNALLVGVEAGGLMYLEEIENVGIYVESESGQRGRGEMSVYPNPANPDFMIDINVRQIGPVSIDVFNVLGCRIEILWDGILNPGTYRFHPQKVLPSGLYFIRRTDSEGSRMLKVTIVK